MTERSPSLEQAVVEACRFRILDHAAFSMKRKARSTPIGAAVGLRSVSQKNPAHRGQR
jgi:hypothetical protein